MLSDLLTQTVAIYRQDTDGSFPDLPLLTVKGRVMPLSGRDEAALDGQVVEPMKLFLPLSDLQTGDRVTIEGSTYETRSVKRYNIGQQPHLEAVISKTSS